MRQAIADACDTCGISFNGDYVITLASTLDIGKNLTIDGSSHTVVIDGNQAYQVMNVSAPLTINSLTIQNGDVSGDGGGLWTDQPLTLTNVSFLTNTASGAGGALIVNNSAVLSNVTFISNTAQAWVAGGAYISDTATINGGWFERNTRTIWAVGWIQMATLR